MIRIVAVCMALLLLVACQAGATVSMIETFNGSFAGGPTGPMPSGWTYFGYGPPSYTTQETGLVLAPNDGTNSAWRINLNQYCSNGTIAIYKSGFSIDRYALPGQAIDWTQPVYLKADVYGADYDALGMLKQTLSMQGYNRTETPVEWGDNGVANGQWATISTKIDPGQAGKSGNLILFLDFNRTHTTTDENAAIWENLRIEYTPVPEPSSLLALGTGLVGLGGLIRRRR